MLVAVGRLKVVNNLAFVPDVVAGGHHVDAEIEEFFGERRRDAEAGRGVFAVGDYQIDGVLLNQRRQAVFRDTDPDAVRSDFHTMDQSRND